MADSVWHAATGLRGVPSAWARVDMIRHWIQGLGLG